MGLPGLRLGWRRGGERLWVGGGAGLGAVICWRARAHPGLTEQRRWGHPGWVLEPEFGHRAPGPGDLGGRILLRHVPVRGIGVAVLVLRM